MTLRLASFNVLHGMPVLGGVPSVPRDGSGRPVGPPTVDDDVALRAAVAALDADVLGLQEVDVDQPRSGSAHQVRAAAEELGAASWRFVATVVGTPGEPGWRPALDVADGGHDLPDVPPGPLYGVGLVSRRPVLEWRTRRFDAAPWTLPLVVPGDPRPQVVRVPDEPRAAIAAVVEGDRGPVTVVTTHLSFVPGYNVRQLRELRRWVADLPRPLVLLGDLNLPGAIPRRTTGWTRLLSAATYPSVRPRVQFDHVLADGLTRAAHASARARVLPLPVSDHAAVAVDLDV